MNASLPGGEGAPCRVSVRRALLASLTTWAFLLAGTTGAQARAEVSLGVARTPVAEAWNPLEARVRDAPAATLVLTADAGGLQRGEVIQTTTWTFPDAAGVQRLDVDVPLPSWRALSWRIEYRDRVLASGTWGARDRDPRPLDVVVTARPAAWSDALGPDARVIFAGGADLPARAAGWDGVASLIIDGTAAAPEASTVLTAAASGVRVAVAPGGRAGHAPLARLVAAGPRRVGAGSLAPLQDAEGGEVGAPDASAWSHAARRQTLQAATAALPGVAWVHAPKPWVALGAAAYAVLAWSLLRVGGRSGLLSCVLVLAATVFAVRAVAADGAVREVRGAVALAADGLAWRTEIREVARLPRGTLRLDGVYRPIDPGAVTWRDGTTRLSLAAGGRVRLTGRPELVDVPDEATSGAPLPAGVREALPMNVDGRSWDGTWWLWRATGDDDVAVAPATRGGRP